MKYDYNMNNKYRNCKLNALMSAKYDLISLGKSRRNCVDPEDIKDIV